MLTGRRSVMAASALVAVLLLAAWWAWERQAGLTAEPVEPDLVETLTTKCQAMSVHSPYVPVLAEQRDGRITLLLGTSASAADTICVLDDAGDLRSIGSVGSDLPPIGRLLSLEYADTRGGHHGGEQTYFCAGTVEKSVASVSLSLDSGRTAVATVGNGWFVVSWTDDEGETDTGAVVRDAAGTELERFAESVCRYRFPS